jgi:uncharacterized protein involved in exopolysaccharide biosynthesis
MSGASRTENSTVSSSEAAPSRDDELTFLDILVVLARNRLLIVGTTAAFVFLGLVIAIASPEKYTSSAKVVRESGGDAPASISGGLSALRGLGISLGGVASQGLSVDAYPEVVSSREVRMDVLRDSFYVSEYGERMTLIDYFERSRGVAGKTVSFVKDYTVELPGHILRYFSPPPSVADSVKQRYEYLSEEEVMAIETIQERVSTKVNIETGLMTISVTMETPTLAADVANSVLRHVRQRIRTFRTEKARRTLTFVRQQFQESEKELRTAEERLANFLDRNQRINTAELRTERDRIQRQVRFKTNLYEELQAQVTQAQLDLQRSEPVITAVESPTPPPKRSSPQRTLIVLVSLVLGFLGGCAWAFGRNYFAQTAEEGQQTKVEMIRTALNPINIARDVRRTLQPTKEDEESA